MPQVSDIFFDLDHTLWDFEKNSALAFDTILKKHEINVDIQEFISLYVPINLKYWKIYQNDECTQEELRYKRLKEAFDGLNFEMDDAIIHHLSEEYIHYLPKYNHLFDGAIELLDYLKPKYRLHIITNGFHQIQNNKLNNAKIAHYFETITNSENAGVKKPNPRIFQYALELANCDKNGCIMIGDNLEADVQGALSVGIDAILFNESNQEIDTNIKQVKHLLELKNYL